MFLLFLQLRLHLWYSHLLGFRRNVNFCIIYDEHIHNNLYDYTQ